jgi:hypothetical protein
MRIRRRWPISAFEMLDLKKPILSTVLLRPPGFEDVSTGRLGYLMPI